MLNIEKFALASPEQMEMVVEGMRNPMNSWDRSDSYITHLEGEQSDNTASFQFCLGEQDHARMAKLADGGDTHAKYLRMIPVMVTINAPLYWWKEFDTYKVGTVANSCSTMHKIHAKEFTFDDFSHDHLMTIEDYDGDWSDIPQVQIGQPTNTIMLSPTGALNIIIAALNESRKKYLQTKDKAYWWQMIQLLPSSYNQKRTVSLNYQVLAHMYRDRRNHKLDEWHVFCDWIEKLPYSDLII